jgi:hypothetical protein
MEEKADMCRESGLVNSSIQTIWKNGTKLSSLFEQNESRAARFRKRERSDANEELRRLLK